MILTGGRAVTVDPRMGLDADSQRWLDELADASPRRDAASRRPHGLLVSAARFGVRRRSGGLRGGDLKDIAMQAADDALVAVLRKLGDYRGASRFTTWAYK